MRNVALLAALLYVPLSAVAPARAESPAPAKDGLPLPVEYVPEAPSTAFGDEISNIIFLNRCAGGCRVFPGARSDARANTSSIIDEESVVTQFEHGDDAWNAVVACVKETYAPYNVVVVDEDPGPNVIHHEAIVAGSPSDIGKTGIGGVAPGSLGCDPQNNVITFTFANIYGANNPLRICATVAQETAHAFGLDHAFDCSDPMTYLGGCGQQFFRNKMMPCGRFTEEPCACSGLAQNSHVVLRTVFGDGTPPPPPELTFQLPAEGAAVEDEFSVRALASDKRGVSRVELYINGWLYQTVNGHDYDNRTRPYVLFAPAGLPDGVMHVELRAMNDLESTTSQTVTVTKGAPCTSEATCLDGQLCDNGACTWPEPTTPLGGECVRNEDCVSLTCASDGSSDLCTETCFTGINDFCPDGFECIQAGAQGVCWPTGADGGGGPDGCCSAGGSSAPSGGQLLLFALVGLALFGRRRR